MSLSDLHLVDIGTVYDMMTESANDNEEYPIIAEQADFDKF